MSLTPEEQAELATLDKHCGCVAIYLQHYIYDNASDTFTECHDGNEWHKGADVRRMFELIEKRETTPDRQL